MLHDVVFFCFCGPFFSVPTFLLFFCKPLAPLLFLELLFNLLLGIFTNGLRASGLELSHSRGLERSVSLDGMGFFPATIRVDCVLVGKAGVGGCINTMRETVDRQLRK